MLISKLKDFCNTNNCIIEIYVCLVNQNRTWRVENSIKQLNSPHIVIYI